MSGLVGWKVTYLGTVTGYIDENGKEEDGFEGCKFGRKLILRPFKEVTCTGFKYSYSLRPKIVILSKGYSKKACINNKLYGIR